ncbi:MAG: hypothetical protein MR898_10360, partial [Prevotella sp.]|nr:hypothetical protein [Prevotella sp.]
KMKKYIQSMMAFAAIVSFASCSSEDNNTTIENESAVKVMTFTATQEGDSQSTRAAISTSYSKVINWEEGDQISIFDGTKNNQFTLKNGAGTKSATFQGVAASAETYTAVYPYQKGASYDTSNGKVTGITLKATQNATDNSFDKEAALMIAEGGDGNTLNFKNVVGYVKVKPNFDCKRIDLKAFDNSAILAGTGTVSYNNGEPKLDLSNAETKNDAITLTGDIKANNYYYIAVPPVTLKAGWTIEFTAKDNGKLYSRKGTNDITFTRNKVTDLGEFATTGDYWYDPVRADQEVDLGLTITIGTKNYKVIFAKSNLTKEGLAANEYDYGDYFAWGAIKPWYTEIDKTSSPWTATWEKSGGYKSTNAPFYNSSTESYTKYTPGDALEASDDAARQILKGDWRIPTTEIWAALVNNSTKVWDSTNKGYKFTKNSQTLFLPAAGNVWGTSFENVGSSGRYWSGTTASLNENADYLHFNDVNLYAQDMGSRNQGFPVRPVRLVEVSQSQQ